MEAIDDAILERKSELKFAKGFHGCRTFRRESEQLPDEHPEPDPMAEDNNLGCEGRQMRPAELQNSSRELGERFRPGTHPLVRLGRRPAGISYWTAVFA